MTGSKNAAIYLCLAAAKPEQNKQLNHRTHLYRFY